MLQSLHIRNYAIIDDLHIDFETGLNIITGETGAGKSILIGALGLVLGNRADTSVLLNSQDKCFVEATFLPVPGKAVSKALEEASLDQEELLVIRREIAANGKSRSFINDTPVSLVVLKEIAGLLVDLHVQFDSLSLGEESFQFEVLDALANQSGDLKNYQDQYGNYRRIEKEHQKLVEAQKVASGEQDYTRFLWNELTETDWQENEIELLEKELELLSKADSVKMTLEQSVFALEENDPSLLQQLKHLAGQLSGFNTLQDITELSDRLQSVYIELQDISREIARTNDHISGDPERLAWVQERLSLGYKLLKKHQVSTTDDLRNLCDSLGEKLSGFENLEDKIAQALSEWKALEKKVMALAGNLRSGRQEIISQIEKQTETYLTRMGMPNARLKVDMMQVNDDNPAAGLNQFGMDEVSFLFDANKTGRFEKIGKVASGGELSRLMLAIKAQVAQSIQLPALIFDEIDTGISGEAARQVGLLMKQLSNAHQVIAITHQPQIAAKAGAHYFVFKQEKEAGIKTQMKKLTQTERIDAIAKMLSGEALTDASIKIAKEMVEGG